jgi:hypothetical protein
VKSKQILKMTTGFVLLVLTLALTACSNSSDILSTTIFESAAVKSVKGGTIQACPSSTLGEMGDAFLSNPSWRDFDSLSGSKVVELTGGFSYDGVPVDAVIQFKVIGSSFETAYLGINGVDQNLLVLSALLTNMCEATLLN